MGRIKIEQVRQGMLIGETLRESQTGKLLLKQGTRLTQNSINTLKRMGVEELDVVDEFTIFFDMAEDMERKLRENYHKCVSRIASTRQEENMNDAVINLLPVIETLIEDICNDEFVAELCVDMQVINYHLLVSAAITTSSYAILVAAYLGIRGQELMDIGVAALLHDIGLCEMYHLVGMKELTPPNLTLWKEHPTYGYYLLEEKGMRDSVSELVRTHHECYDGSGFPDGLGDKQISIGAKIIAVCADYVESIEVKGMHQYEAIEYIYGNSGVSYDPLIVQAFINNIPIYPLGAVVQLSTGDIGVVANIRKNKGPRPVVRIQFNRVFKPMSDPYLVDLGKEKTIFIRRVISYA